MTSRIRAPDAPRRRTSRPSSRALLHWSAETDRAIEAARSPTILADVRAARRCGGARVHRALRRLEAGSVAELEIGRDELQARASTACRRRSATRCEAAAGRVRSYHERQLDGERPELELPRRRRHAARPEGHAARPRRHLRAGRQGGLSVVGADERDSGAGGRRRRDRHGGADAARRDATRWCWRPRIVAGVDRVFTIGGAQAIGALAYGTATVPRGRQDHRPGQRLRRERQAARVRPGRHRHDRRARARSWCWPTADAARLGGDGPVQPGRARRAGAEHPAVPGRRRTSTRCRRRSTGCCRRCRARDVIRASLEGRGALIQTRSMEEACEISNRIAPEHLEISAREPQRWEPLLQHAGAIFLGAFTQRKPGRLLRRPEPRAADLGHARASRRRSACTTSRSAPA